MKQDELIVLNFALNRHTTHYTTYYAKVISATLEIGLRISRRYVFATSDLSEESVFYV